MISVCDDTISFDSVFFLTIDLIFFVKQQSDYVIGFLLRFFFEKFEKDTIVLFDYYPNKCWIIYVENCFLVW